MRARNRFAAALIPMCIFVGFATADQQADPGTDKPAADAPFTPAATAPCATEGNGSATAGVLPATPLALAAYSDSCGACSSRQCRGRSRGTPCGYDKWCIPVTTHLCPGTLDWDCTCASIYL